VGENMAYGPWPEPRIKLANRSRVDRPKRRKKRDMAKRSRRANR